MYKLFNKLEPYNEGYLKVDDIHEIYYSESGNKDGKPIVYVHGGPGGGCGTLGNRFFDPEFYRIITIDQRGCGKSKPFLELKDNTTKYLSDDMEKIREHLKIDKWVLFGGSWGTTLSLYYAINHPDRVLGIILRGVFLGRKEDSDWLYQKGSDSFFPDLFEKFTANFTEKEKENLINSYYEKLTSDDKEIQKKYAKQFADFEGSIVSLYPRELSEEISDYDLAIAIMECHYFYHDFFMPENYILDNVERIKNIPTIIVHGRYDVDCRPIGAYLLDKKLNNSELIFTIAGHSSIEEENTHELIEATNKFKKLFK